MSFGRNLAPLAAFVALAPLALGGCGSIEYGENEPGYDEEVVVTSGGASYAYAPPPRQRRHHRRHHHRRHRQDATVVVVPAPQQAPPAYVPGPAYVGASPVVRDDEGVVVCSGNERIRVHDRHVRAEHGGPAIVASGNCVVEVTESIVRGDPAVVVQGNARVSLVECRVMGDLRSSGNGRIDTSGTAHRGRVLHQAF